MEKKDGYLIAYDLFMHIYLPCFCKIGPIVHNSQTNRGVAFGVIETKHSHCTWY